ncbi:MAG: DNA gyrase inhibitor YacG [Acidobacteria bacterium]|nr:DNA gyrase inhibitor YacG [Acidobacteriota bacterium]
MKCPICKKEVKPTDPEMPYCSERCRLIDLGMWSAEEYRIAAAEPAPGARQEEEDEQGG